MKIIEGLARIFVLFWIIYTLGEIHRHLHVIECSTVGFATNVDGSVWDKMDCSRYSKDSKGRTNR